MSAPARSDSLRPLPGWLNATLLRVRDWAWDVRDLATWFDARQPYYEMEQVVDAYDSVAYEAGETDNLSTMRGPTTGAVVDLIKRQGLRSVLDIGCGAGSFYHLLTKEVEGVEYHGIDLSEQQVARAVRNFGPHFEVGDVSELTREDFARYDAVHINSVFPFMAVDRQLRTIDNMLASGATTITQLGATLADPRYAPQGILQGFGGIELPGGRMVTAVHWPLQSQFDELVARYPQFELRWTEIDYSLVPHIESTGRDGGALLRDTRSARTRRLVGRALLGKPVKFRLRDAVLLPRGWEIPDDVPGLHSFDRKAS